MLHPDQTAGCDVQLGTMKNLNVLNLTSENFLKFLFLFESAILPANNEK